jgi:NAD(P)-dependent dehydrogenase (short-subunit alcohol dehydrogenase family)
MKFDNKVVIVTGSGRGIGRGIAEWFADRRAVVILAEVDEQAGREAERTIRERGGEAMFVLTDVGSPESVNDAVSRVLERCARIDVLINNAAISQGDSILTTSYEKWSRTLAVNLTGVFLMSQAAAKAMIRNQTAGSIINIASTNAFTAEKNHCSYVASKGGVLMLTKSMAVDLAEYGIRVNAVAPGPILTEQNRDYFEREPLRTGIRRGVPLGHPGKAVDVAAAAGFLASEEATFMTGTTLVVDGGFLSYARFN